MLISDRTHGDDEAQQAGRFRRVLVVLLHVLARYDHVSSTLYGQAQEGGRRALSDQFTLADHCFQLSFVILPWSIRHFDVSPAEPDVPPSSSNHGDVGHPGSALSLLWW